MTEEKQQQNLTKAGQQRKLEVVTYDAPAHWASYYINGDSSGLEPQEEYFADAFLAKHNLPTPVSCEPAGFGRFYFGDEHTGKTLGCDLETYTFLV